MLGAASQYNSRNLRIGALSLVYTPLLFLVLTIWGWLHQLFGIPAWVAWASMAAVALALIVISFRWPGRR